MLKKARAHPRGCGEHARTAACYRYHRGSSPRVRGTCRVFPALARMRGLIPAGAGNMPMLRPVVDAYRAHPRGCGEHQKLALSLDSGKGSSPRVRGTFLTHSLSRHIQGLIPAGAGNMVSFTKGMPSSRAHPRGCGEHQVYRQRLNRRRGSSPRVRGT